MMQANNRQREGLYVPEMESDSCGTGLIANLDGVATHKLIADALLMLQNMEHRGACGCEPNTGDGAGILIQTPQLFFEEEAKRHGFLLPEFGSYGVGMLFLPKEKNWKDRCLAALQDCLNWLNFRLIGYRPVPVEPAGLGESALATEPDMVQVFVRHSEGLTKLDLERKLFVLRNFITREVHRQLPEELRDLFYFASLSYKTIVYKGQLTTWQLPTYFPDLQNERLTSAIALIHSRFSTNTFPKWKLAQPFRYVAHNGEINTLTGNLNWWKSRENNLDSEHFSTEELSQLKPVCPEGQSDSAYFDNVLEMMVMGGRSLPHSMMMMIPEAWEHDEQMPDFKKAFYEYHENLLEPWDGPASLVFTNGILVGATLDRNGLRPSRYCLTEDNVLILASEAGALPVEPGKIVMKGRLQPGKMLVADLDQQRIIGDEEVKNIICKRLPYRNWLDKNRLRLKDLAPSAESTPAPLSGENLLHCQQLFGYTREDLKVILEPMTKTGEEPVGSMGTDTPLAALSNKPQHLANYFKQLFAQVTNPPIDPIRERMVMSLATKLGNSGNFLSIGLEHARFLRLEQPVLNEEDFLKIKNIWHPLYRSATLDLRFKADGKPGRLRNAIEKLCRQAEELVKEGVNILILSDKSAVEATGSTPFTVSGYPPFTAEGANSAVNGGYRDTVNGVLPEPRNATPKLPIPTLLATGAIHHHLIHAGLRVKTSLLVEAGDAWETHHFAALIGFGANAVHPWLALASVPPNSSLADAPPPNWSSAAQKNFSKAVQKGLLKIMSKNGVSTLQSYHGSQIFEALGLNFEVVEKCFPGTINRIEGLGFDDLAAEILRRQPSIPHTSYLIPPGGVFSWRQDGETHNLNPQSIHLLQFSTRRNDYAVYKKYAALMNREDEQAVALRSLLKFKKGNPVPLDEVEPVENILKRFASGAMSFGSISHEAHSTLAIAMNRIGAKSNCGEGGEDSARFERKPNGDWERSAIKQVASGRFGVTSHYLTNAAELQIKMAQGAKPGEGGQLPGHKVDEWIARVRHSTPGVGLISPPPHHDIYSIEDLAQLIFDLKNANRQARISVKLVSKAGVGVIASGVAKAHADVILIAGHDGGTGASPLTSIRHAGLPWELGIAEAHQTLVRNKLRDRVVLQADGQIRTGRDLAIATLLGAEEWGVATAALVVEGCIMMRKCHLNTCPVGIATQDPELRKRFDADPQYLVNFFTFLAQDLREIMAELGFRSVNEMVGKVEFLQASSAVSTSSADRTKAALLDLSPLLFKEPGSEKIGQFKAVEQDHGIADVLDWRLLQKAQTALSHRNRVESVFPIRNTDRATGTLLSNEISKQFGAEGMPDGAIHYRFQGSAGQSFGAFAVRGIHFLLEGEANDYFGKGLSGGRLMVLPDREATFDPSENIIIGNVALYGATSGEAFIRGRAGERFAVRNSGAKAVVEGIGDHGCEYMTGGAVVVLGSTGKNFAAGMSGGMAFIFNPDLGFEKNCNLEMVDIEPLAEEDFELVRRLVRDHFRYTASRLALSILQDWKSQMRRFIKVMPKDLKRVLAQKAATAQAAEKTQLALV